MLKKSISSLALPTIKLPKRFEGTIVEKWANYWKGLARDYKDVALDSYKSMRGSPKKTAIYGSLSALITGSYLNNPDRNAFTDQLLFTENSIGRVPELAQNPKAVEYIRFLNRNVNQNTLRITSLGVCSIMWISDFSSKEATAESTCDYLEPEVATFFTKRIIDIGWWNKFWNLEKATEDYDVNY